MFKQIVTALSVVAVFAVPSAAFAAPFNPSFQNPNVVAYYTSGSHGIVGESDYHSGTDLVMQNGKSGNLQQWFYGSSAENGGNVEGDHSVWIDVGSATSCQGGAVLVVNAYAANWGSYLTPGDNYCVRTNDFNQK